MTTNRISRQMFTLSNEERVGNRLGGRAVKITNPRGYRGHPVGAVIRPPAALGKVLVDANVAEYVTEVPAVEAPETRAERRAAKKAKREAERKAREQETGTSEEVEEDGQPEADQG